MLEMKLKEVKSHVKEEIKNCYTVSIYEVGRFTVKAFINADATKNFAVEENAEDANVNINLWNNYDENGTFDAAVSSYYSDLEHFEEHVAALREAKELLETISAVFGIKYNKVEIR